VTFYTGRMFSLFSDPRLESKWAAVGLRGVGGRRHPDQECGWGCCHSACWPLYCLAGPRRQRPSFFPARAWRWALALAWRRPGSRINCASTDGGSAEHIGVEILGFGARRAPQTLAGKQALFYLMRLALVGPGAGGRWL